MIKPRFYYYKPIFYTLVIFLATFYTESINAQACKIDSMRYDMSRIGEYGLISKEFDDVKSKNGYTFEIILVKLSRFNSISYHIAVDSINKCHLTCVSVDSIIFSSDEICKFDVNDFHLGNDSTDEFYNSLCSNSTHVISYLAIYDHKAQKYIKYSCQGDTIEKTLLRNQSFIALNKAYAISKKTFQDHNLFRQ